MHVLYNFMVIPRAKILLMEYLIRQGLVMWMTNKRMHKNLLRWMNLLSRGQENRAETLTDLTLTFNYIMRSVYSMSQTRELIVFYCLRCGIS
jgi:hypothetical protein